MRNFLIGAWESAQVVTMIIGFVATIYAAMFILGGIYVLFIK